MFNINDHNNKELLKSIYKGEIPYPTLISYNETDLMSSAKKAESEYVLAYSNKTRVLDSKNHTTLDKLDFDRLSKQHTKREIYVLTDSLTKRSLTDVVLNLFQE